jgi:hypothetical protein
MGAPREVSALDQNPNMGQQQGYGAPPEMGLDDLQDSGGSMGGGGDEIEAKGVGYFFIAVPKAIAYYLAAAPALAVAPWVYVGKGIDNQKQAPMGKMELIAYALPAQIFGAVFASWCAAIGLLIGGTFSIMSFIPIGGLIGAVIGSIIVGLIWHPVLGWVIRFLKGSSDARSRSNYFLMSMTATILVQIPAGLGTLLLLTGLPFVSVLPPLLTGVATLLTLYVTYKWFVYFNVLKFIQILVLVFAVLAGLGGVGGAAMALIASFGSLGGGGDTMEVDDDMPEGLKASIASYNESLKTCDAVEGEAKDACVKGMESVKASFEAQLTEWKAAQEKADEDKGDDDKGSDDKGDDDKGDDDKGSDDKGDDDKGSDDKGSDDKGSDDKGSDDKKDDKKADKNDDKKDDKKVAAATTKKSPPPPKRKWPQVEYKDFIGARGFERPKGLVGFMEGYVAADPTKLQKVGGLEDIYIEFHRVKYEELTKAEKATAADPSQKAANDARALAEIYRRTADDLSQFRAKAEAAAK